MIKGIIILIFLVWLSAGIAAIFRGFARERSRRQWLLQSPYITTLKDVENLPHGNDRMIFTNFGGSPEIWYLPDGDETEDFKKGVYLNGKVIIPGNVKDVMRLCEKYKIKTTNIARKWSRVSSVN